MGGHWGTFYYLKKGLVPTIFFKYYIFYKLQGISCSQNNTLSQEITKVASNRAGTRSSYMGIGNSETDDATTDSLKD